MFFAREFCIKQNFPRKWEVWLHIPKTFAYTQFKTLKLCLCTRILHKNKIFHENENSALHIQKKLCFLHEIWISRSLIFTVYSCIALEGICAKFFFSPIQCNFFNFLIIAPLFISELYHDGVKAEERLKFIEFYKKKIK